MEVRSLIDTENGKIGHIYVFVPDLVMPKSYGVIRVCKAGTEASIYSESSSTLRREDFFFGFE